MRVLGRGGVSYERGALVKFRQVPLLFVRDLDPFPLLHTIQVYLKKIRARSLPQTEKHAGRPPPLACAQHAREREFFIVNLLVRIHFIIAMILVDRPCAVGV